MRKIEFDKPLWIASHFGFRPIEAPTIEDIDVRMTKDCEESVESRHGGTGKFICNAPEKAAFLRKYTEDRLVNLPHPLALSWRRGRDYALELVDYPVGVAEAKLIRTSLSILTEEGHKGLTVEINSIGDKESISTFERELHTHLRQAGHNMSAELKKLFKEDIFALAKAQGEEAEGWVKEMPVSVSSLSTQSRTQFKEVIEYLEALGVEYRFAPELVGHKNLCSETLFAIRDSEGHLLSAGYRYSRLAKRFGLRKEISLIGATVFGGKKIGERKIYKEAPKPKFHLIHLGREARLRALSLIELLRLNHLPIYHFLGKDKLTEQMETADKMRAPYLLIVGQKEALDSTVTVRNVLTRAQDTVTIVNLPSFLKHLPF